ncbi:MAG: hypothetical protein OXT03_04915 [Alphaproteobacteria bacterium]|nr:hypothetical protein [Alphaproteobacteria bacterium]
MRKRPKNTTDKAQSVSRQERLKQALRANLVRRKQARPAPPKSPQVKPTKSDPIKNDPIKSKPIKNEHG